MSDPNVPRSVFLAVLGAEAARLHPEVLRYVTGPPEPGMVGIGEGIFEVAGSRFGKWILLARPFVGPDLLVSARGRNVSFVIVNRPVVSFDGSPELEAERVFRFTAGEQGFIDVLQPIGTPGRLRNLLGARRRVELLLRCQPSAEGHLRLRSERAWLRFGRLRLPLPALFSVRAEVEDGYDEPSARHTIRASVRNPILGVILEYRGSFTYRYTNG